MESGPSRTAMLAAAGRAGHLLTYGHRALIQDWLAYPLLGPDADGYAHTGRKLLGDGAVDYTTWLAARARFTEDWLTASGAEQYVILGAGLDSFAWRHIGGIEVYEFDHPATQAWKQARMETLGVPHPPSLAVTAANFEDEAVSDVIERSTVDRSARSLSAG